MGVSPMTARRGRGPAPQGPCDVAAAGELAREAPTPDTLIAGDCLEVMAGWPDACIDHCIADPPFGIASGGGRRGRGSKMRLVCRDGPRFDLREVFWG